MPGNGTPPLPTQTVIQIQISNNEQYKVYKKFKVKSHNVRVKFAGVDNY